MDGVLVIDKPGGVTSHDVVAIARRALGEKRIGHAGTLDPLATGVLVLACGRATRLVRFLSASDKDYEATIRFGLVTDSYDTTGNVLERADTRPEREAIERALVSLRGDYLQVPPPYSAKKVGGRRAYTLARRDEPVELSPARVHVKQADLVGLTSETAVITIRCSAGFYVRSFAHELGQKVGTGACLEALRRTRSGAFAVRDAMSLETLTDVSAQSRVAGSIVPLERILAEFPAVQVTDEGRAKVQHGRELNPHDYLPPQICSGWVQVFDAEGSLLALAQPGRAPGSLHPSIVLI